MRLINFFLGVIAIFLFGGVYGQNVFDISSDQITVNGEEMGVQAGDTIFLLGGTRPELKFVNIKGTKGEEVIIINKSEKVIIDTDAHTGIGFNDCAYFRLTGTGGTDNYGIEIARAGTMGVVVGEFSTDSEVDHLEIHDVGFAGIMAKTDPGCNRKDLRYFIMENLSFHDNYIYSTGGEGFYVGYSWYPSREVECDGVNTEIFPHPIHNVKIYNNIIKDTDWDGLQVGSSPVNVKIYGNSIENYGVADQLYQNHAVQIGAGTTGEFYNNYINGGTGGGISFFGIGNNELYNNVIVSPGGSAIYHNDKGAVSGSTYKIYNNTIINPIGVGIDLNASNTTGNLIANNLIVLGSAISDINGINSRWNATSNLFYGNVEDGSFVDPAQDNYRLATGSGAIDNGATLSFLLFDFDFMMRPANQVFDVGAFEHESVPYTQPPPLGVNDKGNDWFTVYPNPHSGSQIKVSLSKKVQVHQELSIAIYDQMGRRLYTQNILSPVNSLVIDLPLESGMYIISLTSYDEVLAQNRLMIK